MTLPDSQSSLVDNILVWVNEVAFLINFSSLFICVNNWKSFVIVIWGEDYLPFRVFIELSNNIFDVKPSAWIIEKSWKVSFFRKLIFAELDIILHIYYLSILINKPTFLVDNSSILILE